MPPMLGQHMNMILWYILAMEVAVELVLHVSVFFFQKWLVDRPRPPLCAASKNSLTDEEMHSKDY